MRWFIYKLAVLAFCLSTNVFAQDYCEQQKQCPPNATHVTCSDGWESHFPTVEQNVEITQTNLKTPVKQTHITFEAVRAQNQKNIASPELQDFIDSINENPKNRRPVKWIDMVGQVFDYVGTVVHTPTDLSLSRDEGLFRYNPNIHAFAHTIQAVTDGGQSLRIEMRGDNNVSFVVRKATLQDAVWAPFDKFRSISHGSAEFYNNNRFTYSVVYGMPRAYLPRGYDQFYPKNHDRSLRYQMHKGQIFEFAANEGDVCFQEPNAITHTLEPQLGSLFMTEVDSDAKYLLVNASADMAYDKTLNCFPGAAKGYFNPDCWHMSFELHVYKNTRTINNDDLRRGPIAARLENK